MPWGLQGDQQVISSDPSQFREGSAWNAQPGTSLGALCGNQLVMKYWSHNAPMDADCSFLNRDDAGACTLRCYCEDETERWFAAPAGPKGTLPVFTQTAQYDHLTGAWTFGQIANAVALAGANIMAQELDRFDEAWLVAPPPNPTGQLLAGGLSALTTINDTVTYTTGGITLPNQAAVAGSVWRIRAYGQFVAVSSATARNAQVAAFWGATQLTAMAPAVLASTAQSTQFMLEMELSATSATAIWATGQMRNNVASATLQVGTRLTPASTTVTAGAQTIDLRFSMSVAVATDQWLIDQVTIERIK
jgi:hypothetical protein